MGFAMTHDGVKRLMMIMTAAYPNYKPQNMSQTIAVWESLLDDYDDGKAAIALKAYIASDTKGFAPSIGQIIGLMHYQPDELGDMEAWNLVDKAIRNGNYGAEEEFAKLPDIIKEAVGSPGQLREWAAMDSKTVQSVSQSNFLNSYRVAKKRASNAEKMPKEMARLFQRTRQFPKLETSNEEPMEEGIPMPDHARERLRALGYMGG